MCMKPTLCLTDITDCQGGDSVADVGEVKVRLYWGTLYDDLNVPYATTQIAEDATRMVELEAYYVWQTTWLSTIRVNVSDYQWIVGAQYAEIEDVGTQNNGTHWYRVLDYQQVSMGCVEIGLKYDTILTLPPSNVKRCSGILRRWSVADDSMYRYIHTQEPIDLADPLVLSYWVYDPSTVGSGGPVAIAGFPYDMSAPPSVVSYVNPDGKDTLVYYPKLDRASQVTNFVSSIKGHTLNSGDKPYMFNDGLSYYPWEIGTDVYETYSQAIALGHDITVNGYILPNGLLVDVSGRNPYVTITGKSVYTYIANGAWGLTASSCKNNKANAINRHFSLSSPATGDSVTVNNYQLDDLRLDVYCEPYSAGCFMARFHTYMHNTTTPLYGAVKSPGWQMLTITSGLGFGSQKAYMENVMSADTAMLSARYDKSQNALEADAAQRYSNATMINAGLSAAQGILGIGINAATGKYGMNPTDIGINVAQQLGNVGVQLAQTAISSTTGVHITQDRLSLASERVDAELRQQLAILNYRGNAGLLTPPNVKYAGTDAQTGETWTFVVCKSEPSARDLQRIDKFFTMFGYNVDGEALTNPSQLHTREKFTFIQCDDFRMLETYTAGPQRISDIQTITDLQRRYSQGLRIWHTTPDYSFTDNPIV